MTDEQKTPGLTIYIPPPRKLAKAVAADHDTRTAEILRVVQRARGTVSKTSESECPEAMAMEVRGLMSELRALRDGLPKATLVPNETIERLAAPTKTLERSVVAPGEKVADLQRDLNAAVREQRESAQRTQRQLDTLFAWHDWWHRTLTIWGTVLAIVLAMEAGYVWRADSLARTTHDILEQILENQTKAQGGKGAKR